MPYFGHRKGLVCHPGAPFSKLRTRIRSGANQYNCEELGRKVDAQKGVTFKVLPPVLSFTLLRFEMDWSADPPQRNKITDKMSFPLEIDMQVDKCRHISV